MIELEREFFNVSNFMMLHVFIQCLGNNKSNYSLIYSILLQVPFDSTIGDAFELFFILHKIFKMRCDPNLERLFNFIEHFIFEMGVDLDSANNNGKKRVFKSTTAMQLLFDQLNENE